MAIERVIKFKVSADGKVTCNGSRRPQLAGVQGENKVCRLDFDVSEIWSDAARYFLEFVLGGGTPIITTEETAEMTVDEENRVVSVLLGTEITGEGGQVEIHLVEELLDEATNSSVEGSTYVAFIYFRSKREAILSAKKTTYGLLREVNEKYDEMKSGLDKQGETIEFHTSEIGKLQNIPIVYNMYYSDDKFNIDYIINQTTRETRSCALDLTKTTDTIYLVKDMTSKDYWFIATSDDVISLDSTNFFKYAIAKVCIEDGAVVNYYPYDCTNLKEYVDKKADKTQLNKTNANVSNINMHNVVIPIGLPENDKENKVLTFPNFVYNSTYYYISESGYDYSACELNTPYYVHAQLEDVSDEWGNATILVSENATEIGYKPYCQFKVFDEGVSYIFYCNNAFTLGLGDKFRAINENKADTSYVNEKDLALGQRIDELQENKAEQTQVDSIAEGLGSVQTELTNKTAYGLNTPGLYNESNELIKSWDELIADGDITVTDNAITGNNLTNSGKLIIDSSITSIGERAFVDATVTDIVIPNSVTSIGNAGFEWCDSLINITIPDSITRINNYAFSWCESLTSITIPDSVTSIGQNAFANCTSLINVKLSHNLTSIELSAFSYCSNLKSLEIPKGITVIPGSTFEGCSSLESITIPNSVTSIEYGAFIDCDSLTDVYYRGTKTQWNSITIGADNTPLTNATIHYSLTNEVYNALNNRADKTSNTNDHNKFISDLNYTGSTAERIAFTELNKRISTNGSTGTVVDLNGVTDPTYNCTIIDCNAGDYFYVNASGGTAPRAWAFIDKDNKLLSKSNVDVEYHGELKAPTNAKKLIVNTKCKEFYCYKGRSLNNRIAANETSITSIKSNYATKSYVSSGYLSNDKYPVTESTENGDDYAINYISPISHNLEITRAYSSTTKIFVCGKNLLNDNSVQGTSISGTWTSDYLYISLPAAINGYKLVINEMDFNYFDGLTATIEFFDDSQNLLGSTTVDNGIFLVDSYGTQFDDSSYNYSGTYSIKITLNNADLTLESLMITLPECSNDYVPFQSNGFYLFGDSDVIDYISALYPTTIIIGGADNFTITKYNRDDIRGTFKDINNKVDISDVDKRLSKTSPNPIANIGVMDGLTPIIEVLKLDGIYIIGVTLSSIGTNAFKNNTDIKKASIANSVTIINTSAFYGCSSLTNIILPSNLKSIGQTAFASCTSLTNITIPSTVTTINNSAFSTCTSLTSVTIPKNVTSIGSGVFFKCKSLTSINVDSSNNNYCSIDGVLFNKSKTIIMQYPLGSTNTSYTIPSTVTTINSNVFSYCSSLTNLVIPEGVISIGQSAFSNCTSLESVTIPSTVTTINGYAFNECTSLTSVVIPDKITTINSNTFYKCTSLASVTIGSGVTTIKEDAFMYCSSLTNLVIPDGVTTIGSFAFADCRGLTSVTLPSSITSIVYNTFGNCTALSEVILGSDFNSNLTISSGRYTADVMVAMFNNLKDLTGATAKTLTLGSTNLAKLTSEQKAIATNKNWNLA